MTLPMKNPCKFNSYREDRIVASAALKAMGSTVCLGTAFYNLQAIRKIINGVLILLQNGSIWGNWDWRRYALIRAIASIALELMGLFVCFQRGQPFTQACAILGKRL